MGNSLLQSGAALGAILTPLIIAVLIPLTGDWRHPFWAIGTLGLVWVFLWLLTVREGDITAPSQETQSGTPSGTLDRPSPEQVRRFIALVILVVTINASWHFFRAWLPLFLQLEAGYSEEDSLHFMAGYYTAADLGTLSAGAATLLLVRIGIPLHRSRLLVFVACAFVLAPVSLAASAQPPGVLLLVLLLLIGFTTLSLFPVYYSLSQELTTKHQGKVSGTLGFSCWMAMALVHQLVGRHVEATESYRSGIAVAGLVPLVGFLAVVFLWGSDDARRTAG
jgi:ACS family hexuronate transporter-like MFS transporter